MLRSNMNLRFMDISSEKKAGKIIMTNSINNIRHIENKDMKLADISATS